VPTPARHVAALDDSSWRQEQAAQSRQRIIQAGRDLFVNMGYGRTTIAEIASAATIYAAFRNKHTVLHQVWYVGSAATRRTSDFGIGSKSAP